MNDDNSTTSETSPKAKNEEKKDLPTLPAETSIEDSTKSAEEKKVVLVKPGEPDVKSLIVQITQKQQKQKTIKTVIKLTPQTIGFCCSL